MLNQIEHQFVELVKHLKETWPPERKQNFQKELKSLSTEEIPNEYKKSLNFYQSLSGQSQQLMWKLVHNPETKKVFIK